MHKTMDTWNIMELWMHRMHEIMGQNMKERRAKNWMVSQGFPKMFLKLRPSDPKGTRKGSPLFWLRPKGTTSTSGKYMDQLYAAI